MKTVILAVITAGLCAIANAETLVTTDGTKYDNVTLKRGDPDGLYIEYTVAGNGIGAAKIKFTRLSEDLQKQYGYDAAKAKDYEAQVAKANAAWREESARMEQESRAKQAAQQAMDNQEESIKTDRIIALAHLKQAEADLARANGGGGGGGVEYGGGWGGGYGYGIPIVDTGRVPRARTEFAPIVRPVPYPQINIPRQSGRPAAGRSR